MEIKPDFKRVKPVYTGSHFLSRIPICRLIGGGGESANRYILYTRTWYVDSKPVHQVDYDDRALCLECRVSWVRVPPEADGRVRKYSNAVFFLGKVTVLGVLCYFPLFFV